MFKVGQKVVCLAEFIPALFTHIVNCKSPVKNKVYTIKGFVNDIKTGKPLATFNEVYMGHVRATGIECGIPLDLIRPLDETFAESVLENIKEQIKEEELICV